MLGLKLNHFSKRGPLQTYNSEMVNLNKSEIIAKTIQRFESFEFDYYRLFYPKSILGWWRHGTGISQVKSLTQWIQDDRTGTTKCYISCHYMLGYFVYFKQKVSDEIFHYNPLSLQYINWVMCLTAEVCFPCVISSSISRSPTKNLVDLKLPSWRTSVEPMTKHLTYQRKSWLSHRCRNCWTHSVVPMDTHHNC